MSVRPKIVKLIDKYSQKRGNSVLLVLFHTFTYPSSADLVSMNETFVKARSIFDRMMEDSLVRNSSGRLLLLLYHRSSLNSFSRIRPSVRLWTAALSSPGSRCAGLWVEPLWV